MEAIALAIAGINARTGFILGFIQVEIHANWDYPKARPSIICSHDFSLAGGLSVRLTVY